MKRKPILPVQIKKIHVLKNALSLDESTYRSILLESCGAESSKELDSIEAQKLIDAWEEKAIALGTWKRPPRKKKYEANKRRQGMATDAQIQLIKDMWSDISRAEGEESQRVALRHFLTRTAKVSDLRFLDSRGANKMILALKRMSKNN